MRLRMVCGCHTWKSWSPLYNLILALREGGLNDQNGKIEIIESIRPNEKDLMDVDVLLTPVELFPPEILSKSNAKLKVGLSDDIHRFDKGSFDLFMKQIEQFDLVFGPYKYCDVDLKFVLPKEIRERKMVWLPHNVPSVNINRKLAVSLSRSIFCLIVVNTNLSAYPFLQKLDAISILKEFVYFYPTSSLLDRKQAIEVRNNWWDLLSNARTACCGVGITPISGYTVAKYNEYRFAGCLLVAEKPIEINRQALMLDHGKNCFLIDYDNVEEIVDILDWCFRNPQKANVIAINGQEISRRFTASNQLRYIAAVCKRFMSGKLSLSDDIDLYHTLTKN